MCVCVCGMCACVCVCVQCALCVCVCVVCVCVCVYISYSYFLFCFSLPFHTMCCIPSRICRALVVYIAMTCAHLDIKISTSHCYIHYLKVE